MKKQTFPILVLIAGSLFACSGKAYLDAGNASALVVNTPTPTISASFEPRPQTKAPLSPALVQPSVNSQRNSTPVRTVTAVSALPQTVKSSSPKASVVTPPKRSASQQLLLDAVARFNSLKSFKLKVEGFEAHEQEDSTYLTFNMTALNGKAKIEVLKHTKSLYVGVKMGYQTGTGNIAVRPGGALGFVKVNTAMDDERLLTPRGYRLDQIDAFAISKRLLAGNHVPKVLGKTTLNGRTVAILEYTHANDFDSEITRELLGIDMQDYFMRIHEMYQGSELVFSLKISDVELDKTLSSADLEI